MTRWITVSLAVALVACAGPSEGRFETSTPTVASLRGLDIRGDVAWATGSGGTVLRSEDGGTTFRRVTIPGGEALEYRDVEVFDAERASVLAIGEGSASRIYHTTDAGATWTLQYEGREGKGFLDGFAFWDDRHGVAYGDPVGGVFEVLRTSDGGGSWERVSAMSLPPARKGEAGFAASGTGIAVAGDGHAWFCTGGGGTVRVFRSTDRGATWRVSEVPMAAATPSSGGFSLAFRDERHGVLVGGDYRNRSESKETAAWTDDGGRTWHRAAVTPRGQRACVAWRSDDLCVAVGATGCDVSRDGGRTWQAWLDDGFYATSFDAPDRGVAAGAQGRVARFVELGELPDFF